MMATPLSSVSKGPQKAKLIIVSPQSEAGSEIPFHFNPGEYQLQKTNNFAEVAIPGLETPPLQYVRGSSEKLTTELLVDTADTLEDVRKKYTNSLRKLMNIDGRLHAPPIVQMVWDGEIFRGVVDSLSISYVLFTPQGVPVRAKVGLSLKEYRSIQEQTDTTTSKNSSPDVVKTHIVRRGDNLSSIAALAYSDPALWREIAQHNDIKDPRKLEPGVVLNIPKLS